MRETMPRWQEIDLFDVIAGQMQVLALGDRDDLQMWLEQRKIPRPHRGQETIAVMLVLTCHVGPTPPSARHFTPVSSQLPSNSESRW
jgi:hypothetical protein